ncbi:hypothetical protein H112_05204 [Trichophyton rubrum D6]|uniref:Ankyrin repeat protein n=3 Tax=Trichophyton TaxID=5550 RepID=A0A080WS34_TRIRC|nr:uncharacterized protein TERG_11924 [Trichophyton rubrum CBS 118892]EZF20526.1 hypothetical protein H100_05226 [Trichophyton rubrum MR850]EZF40852.1 hypothetical protein H102_05216 [Trichophyton rubrum CBS 100081]EZF51737.1 hypothetical protein H103_05214 [Trichophyton rubrum CBS 288.86]EZF62146.1 hypothetical protein H104_05207 [Trichophyton rubrum CBS 289.86]EZF72984.1 hypothetical protein H105_05235 [Trichophyton soudanense CBS 452.61]EZF83393.1 hypothetical protein H110_05213 [Trichophy
MEMTGRLLVETGKVDVNSEDSQFSETPLSWAASYRHEGVVKLLLETGCWASKRAKDTEDPEVPLSCISPYSTLQSLRYLGTSALIGAKPNQVVQGTFLADQSSSTSQFATTHI